MNIASSDSKLMLLITGQQTRAHRPRLAPLPVLRSNAPGAPRHSFIYTLFTAAFTQGRDRPPVTCRATPFTIWPFTESSSCSNVTGFHFYVLPPHSFIGNTILKQTLKMYFYRHVQTLCFDTICTLLAQKTQVGIRVNT